jgi:hypothetical protein
MTKGKYAARAARRREDQDVQSEIGAYQHHVARLTAEVSDLTGKLAAERTARKDTLRRLNAMLDQSLSPELTALRQQLEQQRRRAARAEGYARGLLAVWRRVLVDLPGLLIEFGLSKHEAPDLIGRLNSKYRAAFSGGPVLMGDNAIDQLEKYLADKEAGQE